MKKKTFKTQADLFSFVLDEYVEDEEICISEFCVKNKAQAYENLKTKRNNLAEEWNRLTDEREKQIRAEVLKEVEDTMYHEAFNVSHEEDGLQKWDSGNWIRYKLFERVMKQLKEKNNGV